MSRRPKHESFEWLVEQSAAGRTDDECWPYAGSLDSRPGKEYGRYGTDRLTPGKSRQWGAHVLAYILFVGPIPQGQVVRHACDNPSCVNYRQHLILGTYQDNSNDMVNRGRSMTGTKHPKAVLTEDDVLEIRRLAGNGVPMMEIQQFYSVTYNCVFRIVTRDRWKHLR